MENLAAVNEMLSYLARLLVVAHRKARLWSLFLKELKLTVLK